MEKEKVVALGGLRIIGTERHESRRIDNQLRGRSGRQGDPGETVFYISMEDDVSRIFGGDKMKSIATAMNFPDDEPIANSIISKQVERAQRVVEGRNFSIRKQVLAYDDVMNAQRELIYKERAKGLDSMSFCIRTLKRDLSPGIGFIHYIHIISFSLRPVPWSGAVLMTGNPAVKLTPPSTASVLKGTIAWS